jgi:Cysteine-rich secretory protein family
MRLFLLALSFSLSFAAAATAGDYASAISAYRHAHGLSAVRLDSRLSAVALAQARAMASSGTVSHSAGGSYIGAGFLSFSEMLKQWAGCEVAALRRLAIMRRLWYGVFKHPRLTAGLRSRSSAG